MNAQQLVSAIADLHPTQSPSDHLRLALLLSIHQPDLGRLADSEQLATHCQEVVGRLNASSDQHAAVAGELDALAATSPCEFTPDHVWSLVRAIKVQSQILNLYLGS